ncbi:MAG TPA: class I SAM-dependent methyltransferase [Propionibacteriaceae bacterium]
MPDPQPIRSFYNVPGWFRWLDKTMFDALLGAQAGGPSGDIVELGVYLGKSAVVLGEYLRDGDRLVVVDLFGTDPGDYGPARTAHEANREENARSYATLERGAFEANYLALHPELPVVVTGPSSSVVDHVRPGTARFVHVDAGHLYDNVREDVDNARNLLAPDGIVVFDDYRSEHTPGVAAAVWGAVETGGLRPFALSVNKFYGTYGDSTPYLDALRELVDSDVRYRSEVQQIKGHRVLRVNQGPSGPARVGATLAEVRTVADEIVERVVAQTRPPEPEPQPEPALPTRVGGARGLARDLLPPVVTRVIRHSLRS